MHARTLATAALAAAAIPASALAQSETVFGVTDDQRLVTFASDAPGELLSGVSISGLQQNERILGIDFRPATGQLYALGSFSNLYTLDMMSGAATSVGGGFANTLNGSSFGFDFNPTIDRIRVVSDADQNLVLNPINGQSTQAIDLFYGPGDANEGADPNVAASAYTNSFPGATTTQLYGIDTGLDILVTQANSAGTLGTVGSLGVDLNDVLGFEISGATGVAYAAVEEVGLARSTFWQIDLQTGLATQIGEIAGGAIVSSIAVVPAPGVTAGLALAGLAAARRRR